MERGLVIGGGALLVLLGAFAGLFVMMNAPTADPGPAEVSVGPAEGMGTAEGQGGEPAPRRVDRTRTAAEREADRAAEAAGEADAKPKGLGGEAWAEIRAAKEAENQAKALAVLDAFLVGRPAADAELLRDAFDHMFVTSAAIRADMQSGAIPLPQGRKEMARLREDMIVTVRDTVGEDGLATLRAELLKANAPQF